MSKQPVNNERIIRCWHYLQELRAKFYRGELTEGKITELMKLKFQSERCSKTTFYRRIKTLNLQSSSTVK